MKTDELRDKYLDFFKTKGHTVCASDVMVPKWDKTVLFTPAGMNQFKDHFLGKVELEFTKPQPLKNAFAPATSKTLVAPLTIIRSSRCWGTLALAITSNAKRSTGRGNSSPNQNGSASTKIVCRSPST